MYRLYGVAICLLLFTTPSASQSQQRADSLIQKLNNESLSVEKQIDLMLTVANSYPDASIAMKYASDALKLANQLEDSRLQAESHEELGAIYRLLGNNIKATESSLRALQLYEQLALIDRKTNVIAQLGNNAVSDEDYATAVEYFHQALHYYLQTNRGLWIALTQLNMGEAFRLNQQLDSATYYFLEALQVNDSLDHPVVASYALGNLGMAYNTLGKLEEARTSLNESLELVNHLGDPYTHSVYLADLALVDQKEGFWADAEMRFLNALRIAQSNALKEPIRDISEMLVNYYKVREDFESALVYQELFQVYQDSLVNKDNVQALERVKANFEISQRDVEIGLLNERDVRRRQQTFAAVGAMIVFIGLSFLLYRSNRAKQQANHTLAAQKEVIRKREEEKALLLKELNHRVKNNLQMISSLLNLQGSDLKGHPAEAAIAAGKFRVDALALIHQKLYREDIHTTIPLKDYIVELVLNLCYSFDDLVKPRMEIAPISLSIDQAIPIALIVNEWVTNALKYAYIGISEPDLKIRLDAEKGHLKLQVKDNGVGMPDSPAEGQSSFGLKLVHSLSKQLKAEIDCINTPGTSWTMTMLLT